MKKQTFVFAILVVVTMLLSACEGTAAPLPSALAKNSAPAPAPTQTKPAPTIAAPAPTQQIQPASNPATYVVDGQNVKVYDADGKTLAELTFDVDAPTEWLKGREGVNYLFQSGINRTVKVTITLQANAAFAVDGDWMQIRTIDLGVVNDASDFMAFADAEGTYTFTASSFGLAVGPYRAADDKAGYVLADRKAATNDERPIFYLSNDGTVTEIK